MAIRLVGWDILEVQVGGEKKRAWIGYLHEKWKRQ